MSVEINSVSSTQPTISLVRAAAEPSSSFGSIVSNVASTAGSVLTGLAGGITGISADNMALINQQIAMQKEMQLVSLYSNILKSKHETEMAAIRNVRVG